LEIVFFWCRYQCTRLPGNLPRCKSQYTYVASTDSFGAGVHPLLLL
jgi:hypothetical protein